MEWKDHTHLVGGIITNLQALETTLRYFLVCLNNQVMAFPKVGDADTSEIYLTNYDALGELVDKFNAALSQDEKKFEVDREVVTIRDAIAHGRLLASEQKPPYRLWKFGKPKNGRVSVEFCEELTVDWLKAKSDMIFSQKEKVMECFKARGYQGLR